MSKDTVIGGKSKVLKGAAPALGGGGRLDSPEDRVDVRDHLLPSPKLFPSPLLLPH